MQPFITFYTPTFRRPKRLAACLASVGRQSAYQAIEQIVIPDHVGIGIDGMYATVPAYVGAVHGQYVHILADDDVLAASDVVQQVQEFAAAHDHPPVIQVRVVKGTWHLPFNPGSEPVCGEVDLGNFIVRADIWRAFAHRYGRRYEGDFDFAAALWDAGHRFTFCDVLFLIGGQSRGAVEPEA